MLIVVTPEPGHLASCAQRLGLLEVDPAKQERLAATLSDFDPARASEVAHAGAWSLTAARGRT